MNEFRSHFAKTGLRILWGLSLAALAGCASLPGYHFPGGMTPWLPGGAPTVRSPTRKSGAGTKRARGGSDFWKRYNAREGDREAAMVKLDRAHCDAATGGLATACASRARTGSPDAPVHFANCPDRVRPCR